jgi:hypothetical protein
MQLLNKIDAPAYGGKYIYHREPTLKHIKAFDPPQLKLKFTRSSPSICIKLIKCVSQS